jgi:hypothetical protein
MLRRPNVVLILGLFVVGCGTAPAPSASPSAAATTATATPIVSAAPTVSSPATPSGSAAAVPQIPAAGSTLPAGTYTNGAFRPAVVFSVEDGWTVGTVGNGFMDVQQDRGTPDVIAVQFARLDGVVGKAGPTGPPATAAAAAEAIRQNPGVTVIEESGSKLGGLDGINLTIENRGAAHAPLMKVSAGTLGIDPQRRLWISLFDTPDGVLAVMVGGSVAAWGKALTTAEPVLESVWIAAPAGAAPSSATGPIHLALGGNGPLGIDTVGDRAWVVLTDSGDLAEVDLSAGKVLRTIPIGPGGSQVVATDGGPIYVGRYDGGGGKGVGVLRADGTLDGFGVGAVGGLGLEDGRLWVLQHDGTVALLDAATGATKGSTSIHVDQDAHMDLLAAAGAAWASGDRTPVRRIGGPSPTVVADIETGGGIPLAYADDLVWGARPDELWAIDPTSNTVTRRIALENVDEILALDVDADAGEAWLAVRRPGRVGTVIAVDLTTEEVTSETRVSLPAGIRITPDRVWVTDYENDDLVGIARS